MINSSVIKKLGLNLGFDLVTTSQLQPSEYVKHVNKWVTENRYGNMSWYPKNLDRRLNPTKHLFNTAVSAITVGLYYRPVELTPDILSDPSRGIIARYALYNDYHKVMEKMLKQLVRQLDIELDIDWHYHIYVDTGPVLEREVGARGGAGFIGKNSTLINETLGSYFFLGEIVCDLDIESNNDSIANKNLCSLHERFGKINNVNGTCGTCMRCQTNCPTQAFVTPYVLDARKCISYLTIENRSEIPREFRKLLKNRIYGCDICQEVCPWNKQVSAQYKSVLKSMLDQAPYLLDLVGLDEIAFQQKYAKTPILRAQRAGFIRNVLVAIGNWGSEASFEPVSKLLMDSEPLIRQHAAWVLQQINPIQAKLLLLKLQQQEEDKLVLNELKSLLS